MTERWRPYLLAAPAASILLAFGVGPVLLLLRVSVMEGGSGAGFYRPDTWTFENYLQFTTGSGRGVLEFTLGLGLAVGLLTVAVGYPLALWIANLSPRRRPVALAVVLLPKMLNVLVVLFGFGLVLGRTGPVNRVLMGLGVVSEPLPLARSAFGVVVAETYLAVPYGVLVMVLALGRIDPALTAAARGLGATRWQAFRRVTLPLSLPGVILAGQLGLVWGLGAFAGPMLLGGPGETTLALYAERQAFTYGHWPRGAAAAVVTAAAVAGALTTYARFTGRGRDA